MNFFKNAILYRLHDKITADELNQQLPEHPFSPCQAQQLCSFGWVLSGEQYATNAGDAILIKARAEEKILPANVIKEALNARIEVIEKEQGRKVYRKERLELKDEIIIDLLPKAFSKHSDTCALIIDGWIIIEATSQARATDLLNLLRNTLGTLPVSLPEVQNSPRSVMTRWLTGELTNAHFNALEDCTLADADNCSIKFKNVALDSQDVIAHINAYFFVSSLAVEWDRTLSFTLTDDLTLKRIKPTREYAESMEEAPEDQQQQLEFTVHRMALEFTRLTQHLTDAFGGLIE